MEKKDILKSQFKQMSLLRWLAIGSLCGLGAFFGKIYLISWQYYVTLLLFAAMVFFMIFVRRIEIIIFFFFLVLSNINTIAPLLPKRSIWLIVIYLVIAWLMDKIMQKKQFTSIRNIDASILIVFGLFWFWVLASAVINEIHYLNWLITIIHTAIGFLISYVFYDFLSQNEKNFYQFMVIIKYILILISLRVLYEVTYKFFNNEVIRKNIYAGFTNTNALGYFLALFIPLLFAGDLLNRAKIKTLLLYILVGLALYYSFSRGSWAWAFIALFYLFRENKKADLLLIILGAIFFLVEYIFFDRSTLALIKQKIFSERGAQHSLIWPLFLKNPFYGIGYGELVTKGYRFNPHNFYIYTACELGIIGLLIFIVFHVLVVYYFVKISAYTNNKFRQAICSGCTATFLANLFYGYIESIGLFIPLPLTEINLLMYIILAIPFAIKNLQAQEAIMQGILNKAKREL